MHNKRKKIRFVGAFGERNFGDDLLAVGISRFFRQVDSNCQISVGATVPYQSTYIHRLIDKIKVSRRYRAISESSSTEIYAGGTQFFSFQSHKTPTSKESPKSKLQAIKNKLQTILDDGLFYSVARLISSKIFTTPKFSVGIGIGPFRAGNETNSRNFLSKMQYIWVRDVQSIAYLQKWGFKNYSLGADICFGNNLFDLANLSKPSLSPKSVGIIIRGWEYATEASNYHLSVLDLCEKLKALSFEIRMYAFCEPVDDEIIKFFNNHGFNVVTWNPDTTSIDAYMKQLGEVDFFLSARFHGVVVSALIDRPCIGIAVDPKVTQICEKLGLDEFVWHAPFESTTALDQVQSLCKNWGRVTETLSRQKNTEAESANKMLNDLAAKVYGTETR